MAALTAERDTPLRTGDARTVPVAAATKIYKGSIVVLDAGFAKPGRTAAALTGLGRASETVDNTGGAAGAQTVRVEPGIFRFDNDAADLLTLGDIGKAAYCTDDQTVSKTAAGKSQIGIVFDVDANGVWVKF